MSVEVAISSIDNERYMLGDETIEEFHARDAAVHKMANDERLAHEKWFREAKGQTGARDDDAVILADARHHFEQARKLDVPVGDGESSHDSRWSDWAPSFAGEIPNFLTCRQVLHFAQSRIPFDHRGTLQGHESEYEIFEKLVTEEFPFWIDRQVKLSDNSSSVPETLCLKHGRLVSNVFYWHLRIMFRCQQDTMPRDITEIGGGYGSLARLWMHGHAQLKRYVIVDLPESLFFSEVALRAEFGDQVGYLGDEDPGTKILLVPVGRLTQYSQRNRASDLVISVGSLQEMSDAWVGFYMEWMDNHPPRFFYSLNYMGSPIGYMYESRTFWAPRMSNKWSTRVLNAEVPLVKVMCAGRDFVETIYECAPPTRRFSDWSVLKGCHFNRATYLEGLELLRQEMTIANAMNFLDIVTRNNDNQRLMIPKEALFISALIHSHTNDPGVKKLVDKLANAKKLGVH